MHDLIGGKNSHPFHSVIAEPFCDSPDDLCGEKGYPVGNPHGGDCRKRHRKPRKKRILIRREIADDHSLNLTVFRQFFQLLHPVLRWGVVDHHAADSPGGKALLQHFDQQPGEVFSTLNEEPAQINCRAGQFFHAVRDDGSRLRAARQQAFLDQRRQRMVHIRLRGTERFCQLPGRGQAVTRFQAPFPDFHPKVLHNLGSDAFLRINFKIHPELSFFSSSWNINEFSLFYKRKDQKKHKIITIITIYILTF